MKLHRFIEIFKDLDPETEILIPENLSMSGSNVIINDKFCKAELSLELFKIKDRESNSSLIRRNNLLCGIIFILGTALVWLSLMRLV